MKARKEKLLEIAQNAGASSTDLQWVNRWNDAGQMPSHIAAWAAREFGEHLTPEIVDAVVDSAPWYAARFLKRKLKKKHAKVIVTKDPLSAIFHLGDMLDSSDIDRLIEVEALSVVNNLKPRLKKRHVRRITTISPTLAKYLI